LPLKTWPPIVLLVSYLYLYLLTHTAVQHDFHIRLCSYSLAYTRWVPLMEAGTANDNGLPEFTSSFNWVRIAKFLVSVYFFVDYCPFVVFSSFLSSLRFRAFGYPSGFLKLFFLICKIKKSIIATINIFVFSIDRSI
jgi:hypothetical protein